MTLMSILVYPVQVVRKIFHLPINEIDKDAPLGENEPALSKKQKFKNILEMADLLLFY